MTNLNRVWVNISDNSLIVLVKLIELLTCDLMDFLRLVSCRVVGSREDHFSSTRLRSSGVRIPEIVSHI